MKKLFSILFLISLTNLIFGQDRNSIISEIDSIRQFGISHLKEYIINRVDCHWKNLHSSNLKFENCLDNILINDKSIEIDYADLNSLNNFRETLRSLRIKEIIWTKNFINDTLGWLSTIKIKTIKTGLENIESLTDKVFKIVITQERHKVEKRKQNGELIYEYPRPMNYLDIHRTEFNFKESDLKNNEMIVWVIYGNRNIEFGLHT